MQLQKECTRILQEHPATHHTVLLTGDFNAVLQQEDRLTSSRSTGQDKAHQLFIQNTQLHPVDPPQAAGVPRAPSYRKLGGAVHCSRIDDILANFNVSTSKYARAWVADLQGTTTDHDMVCFEAPFATLRMRPAPHTHQTPESATTRLKTPLSAAHSFLLRTHIADNQGTAYAALDAETNKYVQEDVRPHWDAITKANADQPKPLTTLGGLPARQVVDRLGDSNHPTADTIRQDSANVLPNSCSHVTPQQIFLSKNNCKKVQQDNQAKTVASSTTTPSTRVLLLPVTCK